MLYDPPLATRAELDYETRRYIEYLRLSDATAAHFGLCSTHTDGVTTKRLGIPIKGLWWPHQLQGWASRALYEQAPCHVCGKIVTAAMVVAAANSGDEDWQSCPHCQASKKKARISWLLGQHPKYLIGNSLDVGNMLYSRPDVEAAISATWKTDDLGPMLVVCEGFTDTWAVHEAGYPAVSCFGLGPQPRQIQAIVSLARRLCASAPGGHSGPYPVVVLSGNDGKGQLFAQRALHGLRAAGINAFAVTEYDNAGERARDAAETLRLFGVLALARIISEARMEAASMPKQRQRAGFPAKPGFFERRSFGFGYGHDFGGRNGP